MEKETSPSVRIASPVLMLRPPPNPGEATQLFAPIDACLCPPTPRLLIDRGRYAVKVDQETVSLTRTEFDLLDYLLARPNRVVSPAELMQAVLGSWYRTDTSAVRVHISHLRRKLGALGRVIQTVRGRGFRIDVSAVDPASQPCVAVVGTGEHEV